MWLEKIGNAIAVIIAMLMLVSIGYFCYKADRIAWYGFCTICGFTVVCYLIDKIMSRK